MKNILLIILIAIFTLSAQALFEVKDASDNTVLEISNDGLRVFNLGDTLMVISSSEIKAFIDESAKDRALSRSFSVTTSAASGKGKGDVDVLEITTGATKMREGEAGGQYTDFSPENIFLGLNSGFSTTVDGYDGVSNIFIGNQAGIANSSGRDNIFIGDSCGFSNTTGTYNTFIGNNAGYASSDKHSNTYIGQQAGKLAEGDANTFVGYRSGAENSTGMYNSFYGWGSGSKIGIGSQNCAFGTEALLYMNGGGANTVMGHQAGRGSGLSAFNYNCLFGALVGQSLSSGNSNVMIGYRAGYETSPSSSGNVFIGNRVGDGEFGSNKLYIDNTDTSTPLIYGEFDNNYLEINGNLHIENTTNVSGAPGIVIDTDGEPSDTPLRVRTTTTASGWTDTDTKFLVWGDGLVETKAININGGTRINKVQAGSYAAVENNAGGVQTVTVTFPTAFTSIPKVNVTVRGGGYEDTFAITTRNVTTTSFKVNIFRVDDPGYGWWQTLYLDWMAWQQ